ncbi:Uncharacterized protein Rs2_21648 [Raphanus sativus]|nr:Uncharacterized protein Rs2_21648 [Raphanus sativus]
MLDHEIQDCPLREKEQAPNNHTGNGATDPSRGLADSKRNGDSYEIRSRPAPREDNRSYSRRHYETRYQNSYKGSDKSISRRYEVDKERAPLRRSNQAKTTHPQKEYSNYYKPHELNVEASYYSREYRRPDKVPSDRSNQYSLQRSTSSMQRWIEKPGQLRVDAPTDQNQVERSASLRPSPPIRPSTIYPEALNNALTEVREAMINYTNHPDPTESTARRERFRQAEEAGEVEETAAMMLNGQAIAQLTDEVQEETRVAISPSSPRIPALLRLGPIQENETTEEPSTPLRADTNVTVRRKPGRPSGRRNITPSPLSFLGAGLRRRVISKTHASPFRRKTLTFIPRLEENPRKSTTSKKTGASPVTKRSKGIKIGRPTSSAPQRVRRTDFRDPPSPLP